MHVLLNNFQLVEHFNLQEFQSKDTHEVKISSDIVSKLTYLRRIVNAPIKVNSAYRTPEHNSIVGGTKGSYHLKGMAVDISCYEIPTVQLGYYALAAGFKGVIVYESKKFVHCDLRFKPYIVFPPSEIEVIERVYLSLKGFIKGKDK